MQAIAVDRDDYTLRAVNRLEAMDRGLLDALTTTVPLFDDPAAAFSEDETTIKTAVELVSYEER